MSTNYYFKPNNWEPPPADVLLDQCNPGRKHYPEVHIGKTAGGWQFMLHTFGEVRSLHDWANIFDAYPDWSIYDEYGTVVSKQEFLDRVNARARNKPCLFVGPRWGSRSPCGNYTCHPYDFS